MMRLRGDSKLPSGYGNRIQRNGKIANYLKILERCAKQELIIARRNQDKCNGGCGKGLMYLAKLYM